MIPLAFWNLYTVNFVFNDYKMIVLVLCTGGRSGIGDPGVRLQSGGMAPGGDAHSADVIIECP